MAAKSSFGFPRLSFSRTDQPPPPILPFHNPSSSPIRKKPSEYSLSDLSPRPEDGLLTPDPYKRGVSSYSDRRSPSPPAPYSDNVSTPGSASKMRQSHTMFTGPPPPIATSRMIYRDEEDHHQSATLRTPRRRGLGLEASSFARNLNSVLFDRTSPVLRSRDQAAAARDYEPDAVWRNLQHREKALQKELQHLLDAQSVGLAAHLEPNAPPSSSARSDASDAGSSTPTDTSISQRRRSHAHVQFEQPTRATAAGEIIPVRQPRKKPLGLRAARAGLARNITLLADLKAEEDANLAAALSVRKKALSQLRKLAARKDGLAEELRVLETDEGEPLARELRQLGEEREGVAEEIAELEERLVGLRNRKRWLDGRMEDVRNRREAGLSGYKNALKEVEGRVAGVLRRPPVKPLDVEAIAGRQEAGGDDPDGGSSNGHENGPVDQSPGGIEFLHMRPERRTIDMAREWWEGEVSILERRKEEVDNERVALEEGVEVWKSAVKLVTDFETGLRRELKGEVAEKDGGKGKTTAMTPEQAMYVQVEKMAAVIAGLGEHLQTAEERGWNLLICAIGAEQEAFKEAEAMLRMAMLSAGFDVPPPREKGPGSASSIVDDISPFKENFDGTATVQSLSRLASSSTTASGGGLRTSFATARSRQSTMDRHSSGSGSSRNNSIHDGTTNNTNSNALVDLREEPESPDSARAAWGLKNERSILDESDNDNEPPADLLVSSSHHDHNEGEQRQQQRSRLYQARGESGDDGDGDEEDADGDGDGGGYNPPQQHQIQQQQEHPQSKSPIPPFVREDSLSENEVPAEFLAEHDPRDDHDVE